MIEGAKRPGRESESRERGGLLITTTGCTRDSTENLARTTAESGLERGVKDPGLDPKSRTGCFAPTKRKGSHKGPFVAAWNRPRILP